MKHLASLCSRIICVRTCLCVKKRFDDIKRRRIKLNNALLGKPSANIQYHLDFWSWISFSDTANFTVVLMQKKIFLQFLLYSKLDKIKSTSWRQHTLQTVYCPRWKFSRNACRAQGRSDISSKKLYIHLLVRCAKGSYSLANKGKTVNPG